MGERKPVSAFMATSARCHVLVYSSTIPAWCAWELATIASTCVGEAPETFSTAITGCGLA